MTDRYAVFGHPIGHSKSPRIHALFATQTGQNLSYTAHDVPAENFDHALDAFFASGGKGINCTVPLKELAHGRADILSERAERAKAVNTLAVDEDGRLYGDNTDGVGLLRDLTVNLGLALQNRRILLLGAGGASRGILQPLLAEQPERLFVANRTVEKAIQLAGEFDDLGPVTGVGFDALSGRQFDLILNATAASLSGDLPPLPAGVLAPGGVCYDLAYGNQPTAFVRWGQEHGAARSVDGLGMLVEQAAEAFYLWRKLRPETGPVIALLDRERSLAA
ncbi:shikimate dehydrogenase [Methylococcus sp. EFPC2]|uniref:shikimate dehydrogenase n=1 Tax=Methylococcus sp. EFPC2 TaxID=2812648 RepID=UPI0019680A7D|nr:shikimate dehydrogenase [Methylococcus sp. EFPC2]QSA96278.1 shikimate dehydrogenase [Methylococcus sp. EFPC2]